MGYPKDCRGHTLTRIAYDLYDVRRGWFESDKHLRKRVLWVCYGGSRKHQNFMSPIRRILTMLRSYVIKMVKTHKQLGV